MITSTENYTKKKKPEKNKKRTVRTLGQMAKAELYRQNHRKKHTHTHSQKEKKEKNIYIKIKKKENNQINNSIQMKLN